MGVPIALTLTLRLAHLSQLPGPLRAIRRCREDDMQVRSVGVWALVALTGILALGEPAGADAPNAVSYQGIALDPSGVPLNGTVPIDLRVWQDALSAAPADLLYQESHGPVSVVDGVFSLDIGEGSALIGVFDETLFSAVDRWLEIVIAGEVLSPRQKFTSVAYALQCRNAETIEAVDASAIVSGLLSTERYNAYNNLFVSGRLDDNEIGDLLTQSQADGRFLNAGDAYADLGTSGRLDANADADLLTRLQADGRFLNTGEAHIPALHNHSADQVTSGTLSEARYDAYIDLSAAGRLDNNSAADLPTRGQADALYLNVGEAHDISAARVTSGTLSTSRYDAYTDLSVAGRLDGSSTTDLLTRSLLDGRYLRSGDAGTRFYGCGNYALANFCPAGNTGLGPNCDDVPAGAFCEADGECGLSTAGNCGAGAWYFKSSE